MFFSAWSPRWRHARVARLVLWPLLGPNIRLLLNRVPSGKGTSVDGVWVTSTWNTMRLPFEDGGATACLGAGSATKGGVFAPRGARGAHSVAPARIRRCGVCKGTRGSVMRRAACWSVGWARFGVSQAWCRSECGSQPNRTGRRRSNPGLDSIVGGSCSLACTAAGDLDRVWVAARTLCF